MNLIWFLSFLSGEFMLRLDNNPYVKRIEFVSIMRPEKSFSWCLIWISIDEAFSAIPNLNPKQLP